MAGAEEDLVVRFIGLDLLSGVANNIGYGVNRLAGRINSLSSVSNAQWMAMQQGSLALQKSVVADNEAMALAENAWAQRTQAANYAVRDAKAEVDTLETAVANRRSLRASAEIRAAQTVQAAEQDLAANAGVAAGAQMRQDALVAAQSEQSGLQVRNSLANQSDARRVLAAETQLNAVQQIATSEQMAAAEVDTQNQMTRAQNAGSIERERIARQEADMKIAEQQRFQQAVTSAGAITVMSGAVMVASAAAIAGGLAYAADHAANFEKQLLLIRTQAGAGAADVDLMRTAILSLGPQFGFTADQAAEAAFHIESVGIRGTAAVDALKVSMMGARIGAADLQDVTNMLSVIMASGLVPAGQSAAGTMATLNAIIGQGNIRMEELTTAFRTGLIGAMQVAGVSLRDTGAALATLTDLGFTASTAGTSLRSTLTLIAAPTNKAAEILKDLGFTVEEVASAQTAMGDALIKAGVNVTEFASTVRSQGIEAGLQLLHDKMQEAGLTADEMSAVMTKAFGGSRIGAAFKVLFENMNRLDMREKSIATASDPAVFAAAWAATADLTTTKLSQLMSTLNNIVILLGEALMPTVNRVIDSVTAFLGPMGDWINQNQALIAQFAPLLVAGLAIGGALMIIVGGLAILGTMFTAILGGIAAFAGGLLWVAAIGGGIAAVIGGAALLIGKSWSWMSDLWDSRVVPSAKNLWQTIEAVWSSIKTGLADVQPIFDSAFRDFASTFTEQGGLWDNMTGAFQNFVVGIETFVKSDFFATMVADFAVALPTALKISLDATLVWLDTLQMVLTTLVTAVKVALDYSKGNYVQATLDAQAGGAELRRLSLRWQTDVNNDAIDQASLFNGTYQAMWQKVHDDTMKATAGLGSDGSTALGKALEQFHKTERDSSATLATQVHDHFYTAGQSAVDGMAQGLNDRSSVWSAAISQMVERSLAAIQRLLNSGSPSEVFAKIAGEPIPEGVALGIQRGIPQVESAIELMVNRGTSATPTPAITLSSGGSTTQAVLEQIRDGIAALVTNTDPSQQRVPAGAAGAGPARTATVPASLQQALYQILADLENARRRGVAGYSF